MAYFGGSSAEKSWSKVEPRSVFLVAWLIACAAVLFLVFRSDQPKNESPQPSVSVIQPNDKMAILIPKEDLTPGRRLTPDLFAIEVVDVAGLQNKVLTSFDEIKGGYLLTSVSAKTPLLKDYVTFEAPANAVTSQIPDGFRAVTVSVDAESGVEGWVRPGARVDVVWTSNLKGKPVVNTIVENAEVLSAERSTEVAPQTGKPIPSHVTLLVRSDDSQRVQLAKTTGSLSLSLRGATDQNHQGSETVTVERLMKTGEGEQKKDAAGWVKVDGQTFSVESSGEVNKIDDQSKAMFGNKTGLFSR